jgi:glycyl-tRNA synthetase
VSEAKKTLDMNELVSFCKRRGFIFPSSEIYGGINGFWDYGPLGVEMRMAYKAAWWKSVVQENDDVVGIDGSIILHPRVWEASGHVASFHDPMVDCKTCKGRFREDHLDSESCPRKPSKTPRQCGGELTEARQFNLMFKTQVGATEGGSSEAYLRPETAQSIFVNFKQVQTVSRMKLPMGIAQIGKAFRNEVNPRNFIFRSREFEQMEMQYFCHPDDSEKLFDMWLERRLAYYTDVLGVPRGKLRLHEHQGAELAHYANRAYDIEYEFPFGWQEVEGIHDRGTYDLSRHSEFSGKDLSLFDEARKEKVLPAVVEISAGVDRGLLVTLCAHYEEEKLEVPEGKKEDSRVVLHLPPQLAPVQVGVFPLQKKLREPTKEVEKTLRSFFRTSYDQAGAIGRRYRRQDEVGTPICVTFDFDSLEDQAVTVRDRDTMAQERVQISELVGHLAQKFTR